jgi:hypothetical protein
MRISLLRAAGHSEHRTILRTVSLTMPLHEGDRRLGSPEAINLPVPRRFNAAP